MTQFRMSTLLSVAGAVSLAMLAACSDDPPASPPPTNDASSDVQPQETTPTDSTPTDGTPQDAPAETGPADDLTVQGFAFGDVLPLAVSTDVAFAFDTFNAVAFLVDAAKDSGEIIPANTSLCNVDWTKKATKPKFSVLIKPKTIQKGESWVAGLAGCANTTGDGPGSACALKQPFSVKLQKASLTEPTYPSGEGIPFGLNVFHLSQFNGISGAIPSFQDTDVYILPRGTASAPGDAGVPTSDAGPPDRKVTLAFAIPDLKPQYVCLAVFLPTKEDKSPLDPLVDEGAEIKPIQPPRILGRPRPSAPTPTDGGTVDSSTTDSTVTDSTPTSDAMSDAMSDASSDSGASDAAPPGFAPIKIAAGIKYLDIQGDTTDATKPLGVRIPGDPMQALLMVGPKGTAFCAPGSTGCPFAAVPLANFLAGYKAVGGGFYANKNQTMFIMGSPVPLVSGNPLSANLRIGFAPVNL